MQQLRFHIGTDELATLQIINVNFGTLAPEHRSLIRQHLDDGCDVWAHEWSRCVDGQRTEHSQIVRSKKRVVAESASLPALIEALQANAQELLSTRALNFAPIAG